MRKDEMEHSLRALWIIVDHSTDPDRLTYKYYFRSRRDAETMADQYRRQKDCLPSAVEVVMLVGWENDQKT